MQEFFKSLGFDIVSGLITTIVISIITITIKYWLIPLYKKIRYSGADISGDWHCQSILGSISYVYSIRIQQSAHNIKGTATIVKRHNGAIEYNQPFKITGTIYDGYVIINLKSSDIQSLSLSTGIFQLQNRGNLLSGILSYRVRIGDGVSSETIALNRA